MRPNRIGMSSGIRPSLDSCMKLDQIGAILGRLPAAVRRPRRVVAQCLPLSSPLLGGYVTDRGIRGGLCQLRLLVRHAHACAPWSLWCSGESRGADILRSGACSPRLGTHAIKLTPPST